ncbi:MAG TPA: winged helix-turn-helix domain-containing protein [Vicinamibacterales bacterium]|nr:winged helix-turn-helix domain-containing protein [Vicinamibacterales bacterium]
MPAYRFGEYELDTRTGELRRPGVRVRLRPQPAAVLEYLLQHPLQLVSRGELQRVLWPEGTFVQFDHGLNSCIKQIRAALWDSRTAPRILETLNRRGYRLIVPVQVIADAPGAAGAARVRVFVMPFHAMFSDTPCRVIAKGLTEEVITRMTAVHTARLSVVSPPVGWRADENTPLSVPTGVEFVLTGSVRAAGVQFRVACQLIDARDQTHAWAGTFDGELKDVLRAESHIARTLTDGVLQALRDEANDRPEPRPQAAVNA